MEPGWTRIQIAGRPAVLFDPPGRCGAAVYLHSRGGESADDWPALTAALAAHRLSCVAPRGDRSWWVGEAERQVVEEVAPWAKSTFAVNRLAAIGVSMGGQGAVRLGFRRPDLFPVVGSIAGAFDFHLRYGEGDVIDDLYDSAERARLDTAVLRLDSNNPPPQIWFACDPTDFWWRSNDRLHEKLTAHAVPHIADLDTFAGGHTLAYFNTQIEPLVAWAANAPVSAVRRLL